MHITESQLRRIIREEAARVIAEIDKTAYAEEAGSSFTHDGRRYSVNAALAAVAGKPTVQVPVAELIWVLKHATPDPVRVRAADTATPVLIASHGHRLVVVDGLHRLEKARQEGQRVLPARIITSTELNAAAIRWET